MANSKFPKALKFHLGCVAIAFSHIAISVILWLIVQPVLSLLKCVGGVDT